MQEKHCDSFVTHRAVLDTSIDGYHFSAVLNSGLHVDARKVHAVLRARRRIGVAILCLLLFTEAGAQSPLEEEFLPLPTPGEMPEDDLPQIDLIPEAAPQLPEQLLPALIEPPLPTAQEEDLAEPPDSAVETAPEAEDPETLKIRNLAIKVADAVVTLRAWSAYGTLVAETCGFFVNDRGIVATDLSILAAPKRLQIDYVTAYTGSGESRRVIGVSALDEKNGLILVATSGAPKTAFLQIADHLAPKQQDCYILGLEEPRGLLIADAQMEPDPTIVGEGWMTLEGDDAAGVVGSPILNADGKVIGIVAMHLKLERWVNYAVSPKGLADYLVKGTEKPVPIANALSRFRDEATEDPAAREPRFAEALTNLADGRVESALRTLFSLRLKHPRSAGVWALLGLASAAAGEFGEATRCFGAAAALDPDKGYYWMKFAEMRAKIGKFEPGTPKRTRAKASERTIESLRRAAERRPADTKVWLLLARAGLEKGDFPLARDAFQRLLSLRDMTAREMYEYAFVLGKCGNLAAAEGVLRGATTLAPQAKEIWMLLGAVRSLSGNHETSAEAFKRVTQIDESDIKAWRYLAHALLKSKRRTEARLAWEQARKIEKESTPAAR